MKFFIRPSEALTYDNCGFQYYLRYVLRVKTRVVAANLPFGTAVHEATTGYLNAVAMGNTKFDPETTFLYHWEKSVESQALDFPSSWSPSSFTDTGKRLVNEFPGYWEKTGFVPLVDEKGPLVERRLRFDISKYVVLSGQPDVVAMDDEGRIGPLDIKTTISPFAEQFLGASEQLLDYQILLEGNGYAASDVTEGISFAGFLEGLKRKAFSSTSPNFLPPAISKARDVHSMNERLLKLSWIAEDIARKRFPKRPRQAHNTPCSMCDYWDYCHNGNDSNLIFKTSESADAEKLEAINV